MTASVASAADTAGEAVPARRSVVSHSNYRPDIDGLRAVAVVSVVGFHATASWFRGGFVGVDIFFVISGYLITTIIVGDLQKGRFSFLDFYARRIKRIFPALLLVFVATAFVAWFRLFPLELKQFGEHLAAGSAFVSNFVLRRESGYFDSSVETKLLLHLWSLAIEEQFYIVWPLVLAVAVGRVNLVVMTSVITIASFAYGLAVIGTDPTLAFYSPFARIWELMIGALLSEAMRVHPERFVRFREARSLTGFALLLWSIFLFDRWIPFPGWRALVPTIGAFLVISAGPAATLNRIILSNRAAVWIGSISYPLYLWHWPLLSFIFIDQIDQASRPVRLAAIAMAVALAWATYRFVELPIRTSASLRGISAKLLFGMVMAGVVGIGIVRADGFAFRMGAPGEYMARFDTSLPAMRYQTEHDLLKLGREECNFYDIARWRIGESSTTGRTTIDPSCYTRAAGTTHAVFIWGDSHAAHLNHGLARSLPSNIALLQVSSSGCVAQVVEPDADVVSYCERSNQFALSVIRRDKPEIVIIAQRLAHDLSNFRTVAAALKRAGVKEVLVIGPIPQWKPELHRVIAAKYWDSTPERLGIYLDRNILVLREQLKAQLRPDEAFRFVDPFDLLCNREGCITYLDGDRVEGIMTFDYGHLTPRSSVFVAERLLVPIITGVLVGGNDATPTTGTSPR